jgi:hypothetical protein
MATIKEKKYKYCMLSVICRIWVILQNIKVDVFVKRKETHWRGGWRKGGREESITG